MILHVLDILPYSKHIDIQGIIGSDSATCIDIAYPALCEVAGSVTDSCDGCTFHSTFDNTCATSTGHGPDFYTTLNVLRAELSAYPELLV